MTAEDLIAHYGLKPHPEGGRYIRSFTSSEEIRFSGAKRPANTAIYFLLQEGELSRLHRLKQDELWHFYLGGPLRLAIFEPDGSFREIVLGRDFLHGEHLQYAMSGGTWFGARPVRGATFSFVGCTVAPVFAMEDLEFAEASQLRRQYPGASALIDEFCQPNPI